LLSSWMNFMDEFRIHDERRPKLASGVQHGSLAAKLM
jgi:hypothetical protein